MSIVNIASGGMLLFRLIGATLVSELLIFLFSEANLLRSFQSQTVISGLVLTTMHFLRNSCMYE